VQIVNKQKSPSANALGLFYRQIKLVTAASAGIATVAVPIEDKENKDYDPNVAVVKNVAEASHGINILSVSFKRSVLPPFDTILCLFIPAVTEEKNRKKYFYPPLTCLADITQKVT